MWEFKVDHVADGVDVDSARRDIAGNQDPDVAILECIQCSGAGALGFVAVDGCGRDPVFDQTLGHSVRAMFGTGEDQRPFHSRIFQKMAKQVEFACASDSVDGLFDGFGSGCGRCGMHADRIRQQIVSQVFDLIGKRCRKEEGLALFWKFGNNAPHIMNKAHVQHAIRFVQDEVLDSSQIHDTLIHQVQKSSRAGYQYINTPLNRFDLLELTDAPIDHGVGQG